MAQAAKSTAPVLKDWQAKRSGAGVSITGMNAAGKVEKVQCRIIDVQGDVVLAQTMSGDIINLGTLR